MRPFSTLLLRNNFGKFAAATMATSGLAGYLCLSYVERSKSGRTAGQYLDAQGERFTSNDSSAKRSELSHDEAMVRAMIENAKESTWRENISNAILAQERFVLPGRHRDGDDRQPQFVRKIVERSDRLMERQREESERRRQEEEREKTESFLSWKR